MVIVKQPFKSFTLEEEKDASYKIISLRLNKAEQAELEELKAMFDTNQDGTALKMAVKVGLNVLQATFGKPLLERLFNSRRVRK